MELFFSRSQLIQV